MRHLRGCLILLASLVWTCSAVSAEAPAVGEAYERVVQLPVALSLPDGKRIEHDIPVVRYQPAGRGPFPLAIINHGRGTNRALPERFTYADAARYLVSQGFVVLVPTRLGYGETSKLFDPEFSGQQCNMRHYQDAMSAGVEQVLAVLDYARQQAEIDAAHTVILGHSVGGLITLGVAARNPTGLIGYVNFAGGAGGNPKTRPGVPCDLLGLDELFVDYGQTTRAPGRWIYAENDQFFAPVVSQRWFQAFTSAGAPARFILMPPFRNNGHLLFSQGISLWRPLVADFLHELDIPVRTRKGGK